MGSEVIWLKICTGSCERRNKSSGSVRGVKFVYWLSDCQLFKLRLDPTSNPSDRRKIWPCYSLSSVSRFEQT